MTDAGHERAVDGSDDALADAVEAFADADRQLVMSDFDGTLAEIVSRPDDATIREDAREALADLAAAPDTDVAAVSGRALPDLVDRVGLDGLWYAGNHGLEIRVDGESFVHPEARGTAAAVESVCESVRTALDDVDGVIVEPKGLTATVHYRLVPEERIDGVRAAVTDAAGDRDRVVVHDGKEVLELRPTVDWDKGRAVEWIQERAYDDPATVFPLYFGDDVSDEAAFAAIEDGVAVRVGDAADPADADVTLRDPEAVAATLRRLRRATAD